MKTPDLGAYPHLSANYLMVICQLFDSFKGIPPVFRRCRNNAYAMMGNKRQTTLGLNPIPSIYCQNEPTQSDWSTY